MDLSDLESRVHEHRIFFDKLVELVPAKFYIAKEEQENTASHHGMGKAKRAAAKQATKEHLKKAKRDRLDPDKFTSTLQLLEQQATERPDDTQEKNEAEEAAKSRLRGKETRASTYEELQERLRKRIEMLRAKRNADAAAAAVRNARTWQDEKKRDGKKQKQKQKQKHMEIVAEENAETSVLSEVKTRKSKHDESKVSNPKVEAADTFEFGRVKMGLQAHMNGRSKKKHKESKEQLLAKATKLQMEIIDPQKGQEAAMKHTWSAALSRASGEKVYDDPRLLKQSIKREKQHQLKSSKKWLERKDSTKQMMEAKQQARSEHIKERKQQKKERKIANREKKLMRPGFEGRREGFINE